MINFSKIALGHIAHDEIPGVDLYLVKIDATLAKEMLTCNAIGQRRPSAETVDRYASDMLTSAWRFAGDPIRFNMAGQLIDGQHRLASIVESDSATVLLVITGLDPDIMAAIDTGRKRSFADLLRIENPDISYPRTIAGIVSRLWYLEVAGCFYVKGLSRYATPTEFNHAIPSHSQLMSTFHEWQARTGTTFEQAAKVGHRATSVRPGISPFTYGTSYMQLSEPTDTIQDVKDVREAIFFELMIEARSAAMNYPIEMLKSRLTRLAKNKNESWNAQLQHHFLNIVFNAMMSGDEISGLRTPTSLTFPHIQELVVHPDARANLGIDDIKTEIA